MKANLEQIQTDLAFLYGETAAPAVSTEDYIVRTRLINNVINRLSRVRQWDHLVTRASVSFTDGEATITGLDEVRDLRKVGASQLDDVIFTRVREDEMDRFDTGQYVYTLIGNKIVTNQPTFTDLNVKYYPQAVSLATASDQACFPSTLIAKGALIDLHYLEDPAGDSFSYELDNQRFLSELNELEAKENRNVFPKEFISDYGVE
jgi:hypothetical protein